MEWKSGNDQEAFVPPLIRNLSAEEERELHKASLAAWLATVGLVLIVIVVALSVAARRERKNQAEGTATRTAAWKAVRNR